MRGLSGFLSPFQPPEASSDAPEKRRDSQQKQPALALMGEEGTGKHNDTGLRTVAAWSSEGPGGSCAEGVS